jgi:hypothetical protein
MQLDYERKFTHFVPGARNPGIDPLNAVTS